MTRYCYYWLFPNLAEALPVLARFSGAPDWRGMPPMNVMGPFRSLKAAEAWINGGEPPVGTFLHFHKSEGEAVGH